MRKSKIRSSALVAGFLVGATLFAFDIATAQDGAPQVESSIGVDIPNQYYFRGIIQEIDGSIFQPWADFVFPLGDPETSSWSLNVGTWGSLHGGTTGAGTDGISRYYEVDAYVGIGVDLAENWSGSVTYVALTSPNSVFGTVQEFDIAISFDDASIFGSESGRFSGVQPSVMVAWEMDGQSDGGLDEGIYLEVGIEPAFTLGDDENAISASFPIAMGFSLADYFEDATGDDFYGFTQGGVSLSVPLGFVPARLGSWSLSGGVGLLLLGSNLEAINGDEASEVIGSGGLSIAF